MASSSASRLAVIHCAVLGTALAGSACAKDQERVADLAAIEDRLQAVYEHVAPATVRFAYVKPPLRKLEFGTGVIVTPDGHVAVSGPVQAVLRDELLDLRLVDGRRVRGNALGWSRELGFGLLKITEPGPWPYVDLGCKANVKAGQLCVALGYPRRSTGVEKDQLALRLGAVMQSAAGIWLTSSYRFQAGAHGVFDLDGRLLGLNCQTPVSGDPVHTSAELIKSHWDDLVAGKNLDRVRLYSQKPAPRKTEPNADGAGQPIATAIEHAKTASVRISDIGQKKGFASGVIVTPDGYVITCGHHGRLPGQKIIASLPDGRHAKAVVLGTNLVSDVGLMKITDKGPWPHAELGHSATMRSGDRCILIGYPVARPGREPWVRETQMIQPTQTLRRRDEWYCEFWTSGHPSSLSGASGGGVFDTQGRVIGVVLGGTEHEMRHSRVELFRKQWDVLAASQPVDVLRSEPLAEITAAFSRVADELSPIAVEVLAHGKPCASGTIVSSEGLLLTKASALAEPLSCRLADGREMSATVRKRSPEHDLAMLKIDAASLPVARWSQDDRIRRGTLIAAVVPGRQPRAGVVSIAPRPTPAAGQRVRVHDAERGPRIPDGAFGTDIRLAPESCGGPVIDRSGRVVGIAIAYATDRDGFGQQYVIPASVARKVMPTSSGGE